MSKSELEAMFQIKLGDSFAKDVVFDTDGIAAFALMTGDTNPLHHDPVVAGKSRFGGIIASGSHVSALLLGMCAGWFSDKNENVGMEYKVRFRAPVRAGDRVTMRWRVVEIIPKESLKGDIVKLEGEAVRPDGVVAVSGEAAAAVFW